VVFWWEGDLELFLTPASRWSNISQKPVFVDTINYPIFKPSPMELPMSKKWLPNYGRIFFTPKTLLFVTPIFYTKNLAFFYTTIFAFFYINFVLHQNLKFRKRFVGKKLVSKKKQKKML